MKYATESLGLSERKACQLAGISPSIYRYRSMRGDDGDLRLRMRVLAGERKRLGSPRLRCQGRRANHLADLRRAFVATAVDTEFEVHGATLRHRHPHGESQRGPGSRLNLRGIEDPQPWHPCTVLTSTYARARSISGVKPAR